MDIQTTLNVEMQDICEKALRSQLVQRDAMAGWAILMETSTGDIKAIVNLTKVGEGLYIETNEQTQYSKTPNLALCNLMEPGSIFKTVALAAALEEGRISPNDSVPHHKGVHRFYGRKSISDSHKPQEGTTHYSITEVLKYSSNVGMGEIVNNGFRKDAKTFTEKLKALGMNRNFGLIESEATPYFATPARKSWSLSDLVSLSYGYASMMTAVNMVAFYNTIANGGDLMKPRLVKGVVKDGELIEEYAPEVLEKGVLAHTTTEALTKMLIEVVNAEDGTGDKARTKNFISAGKTGTARIAKNGGYDYSPIEYLLSFCGFFPADAPKYTCIVQMINNKAPRSGGMTSGVVFKEIAENIMAKHERATLADGKDTINAPQPAIKNGNMNAVSYLIDEMNIGIESDFRTSYNEEPQWGVVKKDSNTVVFTETDYAGDLVPNVIGMGAKDALYLMKKAGLNARISGYGHVAAQSIRGGEKAHKGAYVLLTLKQ